jgi:hypothetical protein
VFRAKFLAQHQLQCLPGVVDSAPVAQTRCPALYPGFFDSGVPE